MKYLIEDENFLTDKEKEFLNNEFENIPFFYTKRIEGMLLSFVIT